MNHDIKKIVKELTLEEKAGLCSGLDFWHTKPVDRLGIPSVMLTDGPHGLRKQNEKADHVGLNASVPAVAFPAGCSFSCSFDPALVEQMGKALGEECQAEDVSVILGPAVNIKRSPLCGRNFEYLSEDPYLAGKLAAAHIRGVESQYVGTSVKHFAANNQEYCRMSCSSDLDERTLREIYLPAFETAIKEGKPDTVMCSYNKLNGVFASENEYLLTDILRKEWGFEGYVMSDWGAVNDRVSALIAGLDLEMPATGGITDAEIVDAVKNGTLSEEILDTAVERILNIVFRYTEHRTGAAYDKNKHHELAVKIEQESIVLLKNDGNILPLDPSEADDIVFIGDFAQAPRYQGGGSSHINPVKVVSAVTAAESHGLSVRYVQGYRADDEIDDGILANQAVSAAKEAKAAVVFVGLPERYESEGYDRTSMAMPENQNSLIRKIAAVQPNTIVVLHNGAPVEMPWVNDAGAILEAYIGGEGVEEAVINVLFGYANPCGHLAESIPLKLEDNPSYLFFPGDGTNVSYREGVYVGYRYYNTKHMKVQFPFGYGLSYTSYSYTDLTVDKPVMKDTDTLNVSVTVTNTGKLAGKEVVQLYVRDRTNSVSRPERELKGFTKIMLDPGESKKITIKLDKRSFAWYNTKIHDWYAATGDYDILVGESSNDSILSTSVRIVSTMRIPFVCDRNTTVGELLQHPELKETCKPLLKKLAVAFGIPVEKDGTVSGLNMMTSTPLRSLRGFIGLSNDDLDSLVSNLNREEEICKK